MELLSSSWSWALASALESGLAWALASGQAWVLASVQAWAQASALARARARARARALASVQTWALPRRSKVRSPLQRHAHASWSQEGDRVPCLACQQLGKLFSENGLS